MDFLDALIRFQNLDLFPATLLPLVLVVSAFFPVLISVIQISNKLKFRQLGFTNILTQIQRHSTAVRWLGGTVIVFGAAAGTVILVKPVPNEIGMPDLVVERNDYCCESGEDRYLIVFVHGWRGDAKSFRLFPNLIKEDGRMKHYDVIPFEYTVYIKDRIMRVPKIADVLGAQLIREIYRQRTDNGVQYQKIYFVAHSMGGLVVRKLILTNKITAGEKLPVKGFVSLSSPFGGADLARLANVLKLGGQLTADLEPGSTFLVDLNDDWVKGTQIGEDPWWYCFSSTIDEVVTPESAEKGCGRQYESFTKYGHLKIAKPLNRGDERYSRVVETIRIDAKY